MFNCQYCERKFKVKRGNSYHERYCKSNPNKSISPSQGCNIEWTPDRRAAHSKIMKEVRKTAKQRIWTDEDKIQASIKLKEFNQNYWTPERRMVHSIKMKEAVKKYPDSYSSNNVCGRVKLKEYKGTKVNGGWELLVAQYLDKNDILWTNKVDPIEYEWNGKTHSYFPDFYLPELDLYIEVKGYKRDRDLAKWSRVDNLIVIKQKEIIQIQKGEFDIKYIAR